MAATTKTAGELQVGDRVIGADLYEQRVTAVRPVGRTMVDVSTEYVEAASLMVAPAPSTHRVKRTSRVVVAG